METNGFILKNSEITREDTEFRIINPTRTNWFWLIVITLFLNATWVIISAGFGLIFSVVIVIISFFLWDWVGDKITEYLIVGSLRDCQIKRQPFLKSKLLAFVGIKFYKSKNFDDEKFSKIYYIETSTNNLNLNELGSIFMRRGMDLISTCAGFTFIVVLTLSLGMEATPENADNLTFIALAILIFSPIFASILIPLIWVIEDSGIHWIDDKAGAGRLVENVRNSSLSRFLGFGGFLSGFGFFMKIMPDLNESLGASRGSYTENVFASLVFLLMFILLIAGTAFLVGILYIRKYHTENVNLLRKKIIEFLDIGTSNVKKLTEDDKIKLGLRQLNEGQNIKVKNNVKS